MQFGWGQSDTDPVPVLNVIPLTYFLDPSPALPLVVLHLENEKFLRWQKEL
jgi:hypothetical protein